MVSLELRGTLATQKPRTFSCFAFGKSPLVVIEPFNPPLFQSLCNSRKMAAGAMPSLRNLVTREIKLGWTPRCRPSRQYFIGATPLAGAPSASTRSWVWRAMTSSLRISACASHVSPPLLSTSHSPAAPLCMGLDTFITHGQPLSSWVTHE